MIGQKLKGHRGRLPNTVIATGADAWTSREKVCLIEAVQALGNEDWNEVSKFVHELTKSNRTKDWCSPLNCSRQFQYIMETVGRQIRKKGDADVLPAMRQHFVNERLQEIQILADEHRNRYMNLLKFNQDVETGRYDDRVDEILAAYGSAPSSANEQTPGSAGNSGYFYFAELSDLSEKISVISAFIQDQMSADSTLRPSTGPGVSENQLAVSAPIMGAEDDEDVSELMNILPNIEQFGDEIIDESMIDMTEFEIMSSPDCSRIAGTDSTRKAVPTSPKVSPQLKNLVRTAIAGTSEDERPRNVTPSAGAPTLSMLLEMPPRDPGQPLPEISSVSKAASTLLEQPKQDRISPFRTAAATLEQLNLALAKSPTRRQDSPSKSKSSSPTLQRLLEGTISLKKEEEKSISIVTATISLIPGDELKVKQELDNAVAAAANSSIFNNSTPMVSPAKPTTISPQIKSDTSPSFTGKPVEIAEVPPPYIVDVKNELSTELERHKPLTTLTEQIQAVESAQDIIGIKKEEVSEDAPPQTELTHSAMKMQPLLSDVQDKIHDFSDLAGTHHSGTIPNATPTKDRSKLIQDKSSVEEISSPSPGQLKNSEESKFGTSVSGENKNVEEDEVSRDVSESGSISMPVLTPVPELLPNSRDVGIASGTEQPDIGMLGLQTKAAEENEDNEELPDLESDDETDPRSQVLKPSKTYSRKERFAERSELDDDENSSSSYQTSRIKSASPTRSSPARAAKSPIKSTPVPERKGRKSRLSESMKSSQVKTLDATEEETRMTSSPYTRRARSKPGSPSKVSSKSISRTPDPYEQSAESTVRSTRSRASVVHGSTEVSTAKKLTEEKDRDSQINPNGTSTQQPSASGNHAATIQSTSQDIDQLPQPVRSTRQRISSFTKHSDAVGLPGIPLESNPSSPCSSTATSSHLEEDKEQKAFRKSISFLWEQIKTHKHAGLFLKPITDAMVPQYTKKVYRPMDLTTIKRHIDSGIIRTVQSFERDVYLMLMNAIMFNSSDHDIHQRTKEMESDVRVMLDNYKATQNALRLMEGTDSNTTLRSPVKLRSSARRPNKVSDSDLDDSHAEDGNQGFHTPVSASDNEAEEGEANRVVGQKTRENSPDITSVSSSSGTRRRSRAIGKSSEKNGSVDTKIQSEVNSGS